MAKVEMPPAQVQEQASPEAPPEPIAQVIQPEPAVKEEAPAGPIEASTMAALLNAMQLKTEQVMQGSLKIMDERLATAAAWQEREQRDVADAMETMSRGLQELTQAVARNAHESALVAKDLHRKVEEQGQRMVTMNTAISLTAPTGGAKPATATSLPAAGPAPPEPASACSSGGSSPSVLVIRNASVSKKSFASAKTSPAQLRLRLEPVCLAPLITRAAAALLPPGGHRIGEPRRPPPASPACTGSAPFTPSVIIEVFAVLTLVPAP
jgi:hypothetical protein